MLKPLSAAFACMTLLFSSTAMALAVTDDRGQSVLLTQAPQRIVSLLPSLTETVCALGACQRLVGVDRYSNWPDSVKRFCEGQKSIMPCEPSQSRTIVGRPVFSGPSQL